MTWGGILLWFTIGVVWGVIVFQGVDRYPTEGGGVMRITAEEMALAIPIQREALEDDQFDAIRALESIVVRAFRRAGGTPGPLLVETDIVDLSRPGLVWFVVVGTNDRTPVL